MEAVQQPTDLRIAYATHEGMSGKHNEDSLGVFAWKLDDGRVLSLGVVADGVGGQTAGEIASRVAVDEIKDYFDRQSRLGDANHHLEQAIQAANAAVYRASLEDPAYEGMSTTVAVALLLDGRLYTAHVGDSRIYLLRDGRLRQLTTDHTWAQEAIDAGLLTREQAKTHPNRNVIRRHLGIEKEVQVDHRLLPELGPAAEAAQDHQGAPLHPGDTLLICSDGLTDMIEDQAVHEALDAYGDDLARASQLMIDRANEAGGKDNITVVLMQVPGPAAVAAAAVRKPVAAAAAGPATAVVRPAAPRVPAAAPVAARHGGLPWLLIGGILLLVLILGGAAVALLSLGGDEGTATPSAAALPAGVEASRTVGAPATAAILATAGAATASAPADGSPVSTPGLIPTLRATPTTAALPGQTPSATGPAGVTPLPTSTGSAPGATQPPGATQVPTPTNPVGVPTKAPTDTPQPTEAPPTATTGPSPAITPGTNPQPSPGLPHP